MSKRKRKLTPAEKAERKRRREMMEMFFVTMQTIRWIVTFEKWLPQSQPQLGFDNQLKVLTNLFDLSYRHNSHKLH